LRRTPPDQLSISNGFDSVVALIRSIGRTFRVNCSALLPIN
jgi:hypothetical protein